MSSVDELIMLGTGSSGSIPVVGCLTAPEPSCPTCTSPLPENKRFNTSCLFRIGDKNLLVDCGKTFYPTALRWFPKYNIRRIDALVLTHAHADAYFGLDDLRSWTLRGFVQPYIDVYCTESTLVEVSRTFPYLVNTQLATGGGEVSELRFNIFDENVPFTIDSCDGVEVTPLPVEHGSYFTGGTRETFWSLGFRVGPASYISDCSVIPAKTTELMRGSEVLVVDGLSWKPHGSHFSIPQAREYVKDSYGSEDAPRQVWLTGFSHSVEHADATDKCDKWSQMNGIWVRPAYDGLRISLQSSNQAASSGSDDDIWMGQSQSPTPLTSPQSPSSSSLPQREPDVAIAMEL